MSTDVEHLTCREFVELLTDYLEGALDPAERADAERHLVICRGCSNYTEQMRSTIGLLRRIAEARPAEAPTADLLAAFRRWQAERPA
jgi:anti-sigma factor RsiW